jgi:hypothetical protein
MIEAGGVLRAPIRRVLWWALAVVVVLAAALSAGVLSFRVFSDFQPWVGDVLETKAAPDGGWSARSYDLNPGAFGHETMRVELLPSGGGRPVNVYDGEMGSIAWSSSTTLVVKAYAGTGGGSVLIDASHPNVVPMPMIRPLLSAFAKATALSLATAIVVGVNLGIVARRRRRRHQSEVDSGSVTRGTSA